MIRVMHGDCIEQMRTLPDESVQLIVTSPPYDRLRTYGGHPWDFEATAREMYRLLSAGGVVCWNVNDSVIDGSETLTSFKQAIFFKESVGFRVHDTMIYNRANFGQPERVRYHQMFEYIFILSKGAPATFNPIKDKPNTYAGTGTFGKNTLREADGTMGERKRNIITPFGMRGNVWYGNTRGQEDCCAGVSHPAMMPKWLARDLIISWSNIGETVLDPMAGSGTTGVAASETARDAILIEVEEGYIPVINEQLHVTGGLPLAI